MTNVSTSVQFNPLPDVVEATRFARTVGPLRQSQHLHDTGVANDVGVGPSPPPPGAGVGPTPPSSAGASSPDPETMPSESNWPPEASPVHPNVVRFTMECLQARYLMAV